MCLNVLQLTIYAIHVMYLVTLTFLVRVIKKLFKIDCAVVYTLKNFTAIG